MANFLPIARQWISTSGTMTGQEYDLYTAPIDRSGIISSFLVTPFIDDAGLYRAAVVLQPTIYPMGDISDAILTPDQSWITDWRVLLQANPFVQTLGIVIPPGAAFRVIAWPGDAMVFHLWGEERAT